MKNKLKFRKLGAIILASAIIASSAVSVSAQSISDTESDTTISLPEVTENDVNALIGSSDIQTDNISDYQTYVYEINSVDSMKSFVDSINKGGLDYSGKTVNLNADIIWNDSWEPVKTFNGTFNGNNHTISGLDDGFIIYSGENSRIENLNICSEIESLGNIGGIAGINYGTINNCTFSGTIVSDDNQSNTDTTGCGGIVGLNIGRIENCSTTESSAISRDGIFCGGIAGISVILENDTSKPAQPGIYNCTNYAEINCTVAENKILCGATGGIVGLNKIASDDADAVEAMTPQIDNCLNYGNVNSAGAATGGIAGLCSDTKIGGCTNYGDITQTQSLWTGGIVGSFNQDNFYGASENENDNILYVNNCTNNGDVNGVTRAGGIIGGEEKYQGRFYSQALMNINECVNNGDISTTGYGGGISGYCYSDISRCINTGDVYLDLSGQTYEQMGYNAIGGMVSITSKTISDCINIGEIKVNTDEPLPFTAYSGGIIGILEYAGTIVNCYNSGPVTGNHISSTDESITVLYGGIAGTGSVSNITNSTFNNTIGMAERAVASYIGDNSDYGLTSTQMTGTSAVENMPSLFEDGNFEVAENVVSDGITYQLTPVIKDMPTPYELNPEKTLTNASYAYLQVILPEGDGYTVTPVEGCDPMNIQINGDIAFTVALDESYTDYTITVTADGKALTADENGVYRLTNLETAPVIEVSLTAPATEPSTDGNKEATTNNDDKQNDNTSTKDSSNNSTVKTGENNSVGMFVILLLMICGFTTVVFVSRRKPE